MTKRLNPDTKQAPAPATLDDTDRMLLASLADDARQPVSELARSVGLSAPATADRLRRLDALGVIERFTVQIDPRALGYTLQAIVRIRPLPGKLHIVQKLIEEIAEFGECDKVTGDDCFVARLFVRSIGDLDGILDRIADKAETSTAIIKAQPIRRRPPPLVAPSSSSS